MCIFTEVEARAFQDQRNKEIEQNNRVWYILHQNEVSKPGLQVKLLLDVSEWMISTGSFLKKRAEKMSLQNKSLASFSKGSC